MSRIIDHLAAVTFMPADDSISKGSDRTSLLKSTVISVAIRHASAITPDKTVTTPILFCSVSKFIFYHLRVKIYLYQNLQLISWNQLSNTEHELRSSIPPHGVKECPI